MADPSLAPIHQAAVAAACWLCGGHTTKTIRDGIAPAELKPEHFAITDAAYGTTLSIHRCESCGYLFCPDAGDVTAFYAALEDAEYERTRAERSLQAKHLLGWIQRHQRSGSLLDIGAGSGILVEQAQQMGFAAQGVEPSEWLAQQAMDKHIPVAHGLFPHAIGDQRFNIITLIDVIEHVTQPMALLHDMAAHLNPNGIAVIVTPDVASLAARMMGKKWWHYRIAHISYFNKKTLTFALKKAGLEPVAWHRPAWHFPLDYLLVRLGHYVPLVAKLSLLRVTKTVTIPLNLHDSWLVIARKIA
jgi:SAM-dependent methyltransferase